MTRPFQIRLALFCLVFSVLPVIAHADYLYTVNVTQGQVLQATNFSFTEMTIPTSGDVTAITNISGVTVDEFEWNSAASGSCFGGDFPGRACAGWNSGAESWLTAFAPGSFLAEGSYVDLGGDVTVSITCTNPTPNGACPLSTPTPEPSTFILFGGGLVGFAGVIRRKLNR